jgi:hypothetical protein
MITPKFALAILLGLCVVTGFGYWRYQASAQNRPVTQFEFIQDPSDSISADCSRTVGMVERALAMPDVGQGSTITMLALGDESTANEPRWLGRFEVPVIRRVIEGQREESRAKQALLANIRNRCGEVKQTVRSPIFVGLKRGVEQLRSVGAPDDLRYLFIQTDGEEFDNKAIMAALNEKVGTPATLPSPIRNDGVHVTFCGMAETVGSVTDSQHRNHHKSKLRDASRADRLTEIWTKLFTHAELVRFEPYCAR